MTIGEQDVTRYLRLHLCAYGLGIVVLVVVDLIALEGWWFFWPTLVWGCVVLLHYFYVKSTRVDGGWADERAAELRLRAYDMGHIESIQQRYKDGPPTDPGKDYEEGGNGSSKSRS